MPRYLLEKTEKSIGWYCLCLFYSIISIRHLSIGREQSPAFLRALKVFASSLLACSLSGLTARGYGEEGYLQQCRPKKVEKRS